MDPLLGQALLLAMGLENLKLVPELIGKLRDQ
nr:hypothetical protein Q903MT_gene1878 [Picea sitchensis]